MSDSIICPKCNSIYAYEYENMYVCPECAHEWSPNEVINQEESNKIVDANGNDLCEGDQVTLTKDLKVKNSSTTLKMGTKFKIARFLDGDHNIDCKNDSVGTIMLKSEFVKKINKK